MLCNLLGSTSPVRKNDHASYAVLRSISRARGAAADAIATAIVAQAYVAPFLDQPNWFAMLAFDDSTDANGRRSCLADDLFQPRGVALINGDQQSTGGLRIEEECHQLRRDCGSRIHDALGEVAICNQAAWHSLRLHALDGTTEKRNAFDFKLNRD